MKRFTVLFLVIVLVSCTMFGKIDSDASGYLSITDYFDDYKDGFKELFEGVDDATVGKAFDFLQEKAADGSLKSESGIKNAIKEGQDKFDLELSPKHIENMIELVTTLENMGFKSDVIIGKAKEMYGKYGINFLDHSNELIGEAIKSSLGSIIMNALRDFFRSMGEFFKDLISGIL
ncbi:MAG: hypothetical protein FWC09_02040 [Lachnospiraceae bacterium]|nr:hypothetical protein [Lachnospiraceae bacterium]